MEARSQRQWPLPAPRKDPVAVPRSVGRSARVSAWTAQWPWVPRVATPRPDLGRLKLVPPQQVWPHEAHDFTPWLLVNAEVLSDLLGMDLDLEVAEHPVGDFSLDLLGRDTPRPWSAATSTATPRSSPAGSSSRRGTRQRDVVHRRHTAGQLSQAEGGRIVVSATSRPRSRRRRSQRRTRDQQEPIGKHASCTTISTTPPRSFPFRQADVGGTASNLGSAEVSQPALGLSPSRHPGGHLRRRSGTVGAPSYRSSSSTSCCEGARSRSVGTSSTPASSSIFRSAQ